MARSEHRKRLDFFRKDSIIYTYTKKRNTHRRHKMANMNEAFAMAYAMGAAYGATAGRTENKKDSKKDKKSA